MKKLFAFLFFSLFIISMLPLTSAHFFEYHSLDTMKACDLVTTEKAKQLCSQYEDVMVACNLASDWAVVFYFIEDGKFYRFTHARQYYNNLLTNAGNNPKLQACAVGAGLHHHQDVVSHGWVDEQEQIHQGYTGQTLSKFFITNALGHGPVERNMVNSILDDMNSFNYRGQTIQISAQDKLDALYYKENGLNIFNEDPELVEFLFSGSEQIDRKTIENSIALVGTAVAGGKQETVFTNVEIPLWWWTFAIGILSLGLIMFILFGIAFLFAKGLITKSFIALWLGIFLIVIIVGFFATLGMVNGKAYVYYETTIDFFAKFLAPVNPQNFVSESVGNSINFIETGVHRFADASGWVPLAQASRSSFVFLSVILVSFILSSIFIIIRLRKELKGNKKIFNRKNRRR